MDTDADDHHAVMQTPAGGFHAVTDAMFASAAARVAFVPEPPGVNSVDPGRADHIEDVLHRRAHECFLQERTKSCCRACDLSGRGEHAPHAAYGRLVVDKTLHGKAFFAAGVAAGFTAFSDRPIL
ncbi:hypothetical protein [Caballeronia grimmiae]|uniref:hypothetical protein n=1 Tax=Caballeronia grimmiae TaxID=1071679 RepID=UPI0038BA60E7